MGYKETITHDMIAIHSIDIKVYVKSYPIKCLYGIER